MDIGLGLVLDHLIDEGQDVITLDAEEDERGARVALCSRIGAGDATWVNEVFAIVLSDSVLMRVTTDKNITI